MVRFAASRFQLRRLAIALALLIVGGLWMLPVRAQQDSADVLLARAQVLLKKDNFSGALLSLSMGIGRYPKDARLYAARGNAYNGLKKFKEAVADFNRALASPAKDADWYFRRGWAYDQLSDFAASTADYEKYLSFRPDNALAWYCLCLLYTSPSPRD